MIDHGQIGARSRHSSCLGDIFFRISGEALWVLVRGKNPRYD
jgi:hypothetical protein